jgi:hypothetical protein
VLAAQVGQRVVRERELELLLVGDVLADALVAAAVEVDDGRAPRHVAQREREVLELDPLHGERQAPD